MSVSPSLVIYSCLVARVDNSAMKIPISIYPTSQNYKETIETEGMIDSRAEGKFIDQNYVKQKGFET